MTVRTHLTRILASASRSRLGALNNAQFRSKSTTPKIFEEGSSKVEILRAGLKNDPRTLQDFIPSDAASVAQKKLSPAADAALKDREEELHRSVLGQQKPDYARADGSFNRLRNIVRDPQFRKVKGALKGLELTTVCEEAKCPNIGECWGGETGTATATIMLMGDTCTRGCKFCNIKTSQAPPPIDQDEPRKVAEAVTNWGLDYVVLTSVDRDDMEDGGAGHFANTVKLLKQMDPNIKVEALVSDFQGNEGCVATVVGSGLDVYAHNIETVERLQGRVRDRRAGYIQSIKTLEHAKSLNPEVVTKSSIMLGVGEKDEEVMQALRDLRTAGVEIVTFGQYLRPSRKHMRVYEYVDYDKYDYWRKQGESMGFAYVASSPLVRSSYKAGEFFVKAMIDQRRAAVAAQHA